VGNVLVLADFGAKRQQKILRTVVSQRLLVTDGEREDPGSLGSGLVWRLRHAAAAADTAGASRSPRPCLPQSRARSCQGSGSCEGGLCRRSESCEDGLCRPCLPVTGVR